MYIHSMDRRTSHKSGTGRCYFGHSLEKVCFYFCRYVNTFVSFFSSAPFVLQLPVFFFIFLFNCFSFFSSLFLHYTVLSYLHCSVFALFPYSVLQILHFYFFFFHYLFSSYLCASVPVFSPPSILLVSLCFVSKLCSSDPPFISTFFFFLFHHLFCSYLFHSHISLPQFQCFLLLSLSWSPILTFIVSPFLLSYQHPFCLSHFGCIMSSFLS